MADRLNEHAQHVLFAWGVIPEEFHKRQIPAELTTRSVKKLSCGQGHVLILTGDGLVLSAGDNRYGQCARDQFLQNLPLSAFKLDGVAIEDIATGSYHSMLLATDTSKRKVYTFGHELGSGFEDKLHRSVPSEFNFQAFADDPPKGIYGGFNHSAVVTESKRLLMWGEFFTGERVRRVKQIRTDFPDSTVIKKIAMGRKHAVLLTMDNEVYTWGVNTYGELGQGPVKRVTLPQKLRHNNNIMDIAAGARHTMMVDYSGTVFAFGDNSQGQCGFDQSRSDVPVEIVTKGFFGGTDVKCRFVYCGETHSALITSEGELFAWGDNSAQKLGIPVQNDIYAPTLIDAVIGKSIVGVGLGGFFSVVLSGPSSHALIKTDLNRLRIREGLGRMMTKLGVLGNRA